MQIFEWNNQHERAAELLAEGELTSAAICSQLGIAPSTLRNWKARPEFAERVAAILEDFRASVRRRGIAVLERRVSALHDRWTRLLRVIEARAADKELAAIPGGTTGLVMTLTKAGTKGDEPPRVEGYAIDVALLKELREIEKQAAQELGQWVEKRGVDQVAKAYITVGPEDL